MTRAFASGRTRAAAVVTAGVRRRTVSGCGSSMVLTPEPGRGNAAYPWDKFDPDLYVARNYLELRDDDRRILQQVRDFFAAELDSSRPVEAGIDAGSGANLYPALSMLPFCRQVVLWERGASNLAWLGDQARKFSPFWDQYWQVLRSRRVYRESGDPRQSFQGKALVQPGDLFRLPARKWDLGTMFFVAESISDQEREFQKAARRFIRSLTPGAPFAAAFMCNSSGYYVGPHRFPAVEVNQTDVEHCLTPLVDEVSISTVRSEKPLRDGYHGMILALGKAGGTKG
jgi:hypothetical protein